MDFGKNFHKPLGLLQRQTELGSWENIPNQSVYGLWKLRLTFD
jgi:hypothetical protein